jgi:hypothetical protein
VVHRLRDFFKEYLHSGEVMLSAVLAGPTRPCVDLIRKHLHEDEVIRAEDAILKYRFMV